MSIKSWAALAAISALALSAHAGVVIDIAQVGANVVATSSGTFKYDSLNLLDWFGNRSQPITGVLNGAQAGVAVAPPLTEGAQAVLYTGMTGPSSFGSGNQFHYANSGTGLAVGVSGAGVGNSGPLLLLDVSYDGQIFNGSSTWNNKTLADLGLTAGTYVWSWGSGDEAESLTVNITAVPEPHEYAMVAGAGMVGFGLWRRRAQRAAKA